MSSLLLKTPRNETFRSRFELMNDREYVAHLGRLAIRAEFLGINDPLTHLYQYLEGGEEALFGIAEDLETDIAERLLETPFVNNVSFVFDGKDFISEKDKVSMRLMTHNNLQILTSEHQKRPELSDELERAKIEALEPIKLTEWFIDASAGSYFVVESLPIGDQSIAVSRIYRKVSSNQLTGSFISLYNPSVDNFNKLRAKMRPELGGCSSELDILMNPYISENNLENLVDSYIEQYDEILKEKNGGFYRFGLEWHDNGIDIDNGIDKVKAQPNLTSIYTDLITTLAKTDGRVNNNLIEICDHLGLSLDIYNGQTITIDLARSILKESIIGITSVIDRADSVLLGEIKLAGEQASYSAVSHYGGLASADGNSYASNNCPEYSRTQTDQNSQSFSEVRLLSNVFNIFNDIDDFGRAKIDVCRINNCPSRGYIDWYPSRTLVGGCSICVDCHKIFKIGKSPEVVYKNKKLEKQRI